MPPRCPLVVPAGCRIASCHPLIAPPSRHLITPAGCCMHCAALLLSCRASWLSHCLSTSSRCAILLSTRRTSLLLMRHPLVVSLSRCAASCCLVAPAGCRASSLVVLSLHCPLVLSSCWLVIALPVLAPPSRPLVVVHCRCHQTPSNATATAAIECRLYRPPLS